MNIKHVLVSLFTFALIACATTEVKQRTIHHTEVPPDPAISVPDERPVNGILRVATLNLAHGRKDSINQMLNGASTIRNNLDDIADVLTRQKPHVVALQEADASSQWSGRFDHIAYIASQASYPWRTHAINADSWLFSYGTALLSSLPIQESIEHSFEPSPPTLNKGFVLASIDWPQGKSGGSRMIDVISVHLDFSSKEVREQQIQEMIDVLSARLNPTIIMGDFNSEWLSERSVIRELAMNSRFTTHQPEADAYNTYKDKRLDWILITKELEFVEYKVLQDVLSDHAMIVADIRFKEQNR